MKRHAEPRSPNPNQTAGAGVTVAERSPALARVRHNSGALAEGAQASEQARVGAPSSPRSPSLEHVLAELAERARLAQVELLLAPLAEELAKLSLDQLNQPAVHLEFTRICALVRSVAKEDSGSRGSRGGKAASAASWPRLLEEADEEPVAEEEPVEPMNLSFSEAANIEGFGGVEAGAAAQSFRRQFDEERSMKVDVQKTSGSIRKHVL